MVSRGGTYGDLHGDGSEVENPVLNAFAQEARRNVELYERYPLIDDPIKAINFALGEGNGIFDTSDPMDFLETWRDGNWAAIQDLWPKYLDLLTTK